MNTVLQLPVGALQATSPDIARRLRSPAGGAFAAGLVAEDFRTNDRDPFYQGFLMLLVHRFGNWRMGCAPSSCARR